MGAGYARGVRSMIRISSKSFQVIGEREACHLKPETRTRSQKLQARNREEIDIGELQIEFQDCLLIIHSISSDTIVNQLERILVT